MKVPARYGDVAFVVLRVVVGVLFAVRHGRPWLASGALASALVALFALNVANPQAVVVNRNLDHFERTGRLDVEYLTTLSSDAMPAAAAIRDPRVARWLCTPPPEPNNGLSFNLSRHRAEGRCR